MSMNNLTDLDARLLALLQKDASRSVADIAALAKTSAATCWRRIRQLEKRGILGKHVRLVNPASVGRTLDAFCQVRMKSQGSQSRADFQRAMDQEPTIVEVYSISGEWDYLLHLLVRDVADLNAILMRCVLEHKSVAGTATIFALKRVKHVSEVPI